jgi:fumarate hydratase class II
MSSFDAQSSVNPAGDADEVGGETERIAAQVENVAQSIVRLIESGAVDGLPDAALQQLFKTCVQLYALKVDAGRRFAPCGDNRDISATSIMVTASGLLKGANLELFELGMWQSFSGTR